MTTRRPASAPAGRMSDDHFKATVTELQRLVLGGRPERPELIPTKREIVNHLRSHGAR